MHDLCPVVSIDAAIAAVHAQWEEYLLEYNSKHTVYFRLHQEMQDTKIKVEGLRQVHLCKALVNFTDHDMWQLQ